MLKSQRTRYFEPQRAKRAKRAKRKAEASYSYAEKTNA
jgi:hypothetical protein